MMKEIKQNEKGFTLVELVVVIAILAVLAVLLVPRIIGNVEDARRSGEMSDARTLISEIQTWNAMEMSKPASGTRNTIPADLGTGALTAETQITDAQFGGTDLAGRTTDYEFVQIHMDTNGDVFLTDENGIPIS